MLYGCLRLLGALEARIAGHEKTCLLKSSEDECKSFVWKHLLLSLQLLARITLCARRQYKSEGLQSIIRQKFLKSFGRSWNAKNMVSNNITYLLFMFYF